MRRLTRYNKLSPSIGKPIQVMTKLGESAGIISSISEVPDGAGPFTLPLIGAHVFIAGFDPPLFMKDLFYDGYLSEPNTWRYA